MATDNFCFYLQNTLIKTSQTGGQRYCDTSPFSIPCKFDILFDPNARNTVINNGFKSSYGSESSFLNYHFYYFIAILS
jgi:hypothetical protein